MIPLFATLLLIVHFAFLQTWRYIPLLQNLPALIVILTITVVFALPLLLLLPRKSFIEFRPKSLLESGIIICVACISWYYWSYPRLFLDMHTLGDEDFHFGVSQGVQSYLLNYLQFQIPAEASPNHLRYPQLMYLLFALDPRIDEPGPMFTFWHRLPLALPYVGAGLATYFGTKSLNHKRSISLLTALTVLTSPLLISFTSDKYLDIGHPILYILWGFNFLQAVRGSEKQLVNAAYLAAIIPLVRESGAPVAVVTAFGCLGWGSCHGHRMKGLLLSSVSLAPFLVYYLAKSAHSTIDTARVSLGYLLQQDYLLLIEMFPIYIPGGLLLLSLYALVRPHDSSTRNVLFGLVAAFIGETILYGMFDPGWIPWSRNYLMYYGPFVIGGVLGISSLISRFKKPGYHLACFILLLSTAFNIFLNCTELDKNFLFHENEIVYRYSDLRTHLEVNRSKFEGYEICFSIPVQIPSSFLSQQMPANISVVPIGWDKTDFDWRNFMRFSDFEKRLKSSCRYALFHWRLSTTQSPTVRGRMVPRPLPVELANYTVLLDLPDPLSQGGNGILLLERKG